MNRNKVLPKIAAFYSLTLVISWSIWAVMLTNTTELKFLHLVGGLGPAMAFLLISLKNKNSTAVTSAFKFPKLSVLVIASALPWLIMALSVLISPGNFNLGKLFINDEFPQLASLYIPLSIFFYGLGEELGWRKALIPKIMQLGYSLKVANIIFTPFWALWHAPLFWYEFGYAGMDFATGIGWVFSLMLGTILLAVIYKNSNGSIWPVAVFHGLLDVVMLSTAVSETQMILMNVIVLLIGLILLFITNNDLDFVFKRKSDTSR